MSTDQIVDGLFWFMAFLVSTTFHEAAHAFVAWRGGDSTAYRGGQVSLSPLPHIRREPVGMLLVPLLTALNNGWAVGWASTPFNVAWSERYPRRAALMSAAGPAANFLLALLAWIAIRAGLAAHAFAMPVPESITMSRLVEIAGGGRGAGSFVTEALSIMLMLNVLLGTFNLLPLPPLDGGSIAGLFLPEATARRLGQLVRTPAMSLVGLVVAWQLFKYIASPLFGLVARSLYPDLVFR